MRECLIAGAAPAADRGGFYRAVLLEAPLVVAADAAGEWCAGLGRVPDATVGDFDSAATGAEGRLSRLGSAIVKLPEEKDFSDLDACLELAREHGAERVTFTAAFSGRIDHTLAALGTVLRAADLDSRVDEPAWWARTLTPAGKEMRLELAEGVLFTIVSPGGASGVTVRGARYRLEGASLDAMSSRGLSNVSLGGVVRIRVGAGALLVMVHR